MAIDLAPPEWLIAYIRGWAWRLRLYPAWKIQSSLHLLVADNPDTRAMCVQQPDINLAELQFRADVEDNKDWQKTAIHELLHVSHARIDHFFDLVVIPALPEPTREVIKQMYGQLYESYTDMMAGILQELEPENIRYPLTGEGE